MRRVLESLFRYFDNGNLWSPEHGLAFPVLKDMQLFMDNSGIYLLLKKKDNSGIYVTLNSFRILRFYTVVLTINYVALPFNFQLYTFHAFHFN
jgi:hypothetical protein